MIERYYELQKETVSAYTNVVSTLAFPIKLNFKVIGDAKQKKLIVIKKISDAYAYMSGFQVLVTINEPLFEKLELDAKAIEVLFVDELNNLQVNAETGAIKISKPNFVTCVSVLEKFTSDEVIRVKDLERLTVEQSNEKEQELNVDSNTTY